MAKKTKHYILKKGVPMSFIKGGEPVRLVGDGKGTVELNDDQATSFKDKLAGESADAVEFETSDEGAAGSDINQAAEEGMASNDDAATAAAVEEAKANEGKTGDDKPKEPVGGAVKK